MKHAIEIRGVAVGLGIPKVCVPLAGSSMMELLDEASAAKEVADIVEWRADYFDALADEENFAMTLRVLRGALGNIPLLFTYRNEAEGGRGNLAPEEYVKLNKTVAASGNIDMLDVEFSTGEEVFSEIMDLLRAAKVVSVMSYHNFVHTPAGNEMVDLLRRMADTGADIPKLAVMAHSTDDMLCVLNAAHEYTGKYAKGPAIAIAMGKCGALSRLAGEFVGSDITFGCLKETTAPGQIEAVVLKKMLRRLHAEQ